MDDHDDHILTYFRRIVIDVFDLNRIIYTFDIHLDIRLHTHSLYCAPMDLAPNPPFFYLLILFLPIATSRALMFSPYTTIIYYLFITYRMKV